MDHALAVALHNLSLWSLGFLCGWTGRTLIHRLRQGEPMRQTIASRQALAAALTTLMIAVLVTIVVVLAEMYGNSSQLQGLWNACRHLNYPLGVIVAAGVVYRIVLIVFDDPPWRDERSIHLLAWLVYIAANLVAAALTSHHYEIAGTDATWVSGLRTVLMIGAVVLTAWWPHPLRRTPIKETR